MVMCDVDVKVVDGWRQKSEKPTCGNWGDIGGIVVFLNTRNVNLFLGNCHQFSTEVVFLEM